MPNHELIAEPEKQRTLIPCYDEAMDLIDRAAAALRELQGALSAQDRMQNEQIDKHRDTELLALPEHIVASSHVVEDLLDHFYGLLCNNQKTIAELQANTGELALQNAKLLTDVDQLLSDRNKLQAELEQAKAEINLLHAQCRSAYDALYEEECARVNAERKALKGGEDE